MLDKTDAIVVAHNLDFPSQLISKIPSGANPIASYHDTQTHNDLEDLKFNANHCMENTLLIDQRTYSAIQRDLNNDKHMNLTVVDLTPSSYHVDASALVERAATSHDDVGPQPIDSKKQWTMVQRKKSQSK